MSVVWDYNEIEFDNLVEVIQQVDCWVDRSVLTPKEMSKVFAGSQSNGQIITTSL